MSSEPAANWQLRIHERVLQGDPAACNELAEAALDWLVGQVQAARPHLRDPHLAVDAAVQSLMDYQKRPDAFNDEKLTLFAYLQMAARADLMNLERGITRREKRESSKEVVELEQLAGNVSIETHESHPFDIAQLRRDTEVLFSDPIEQQCWRLMLEGERRTETFARVMGIAELPILEQRRKVKQIKDRIRKRVERSKASENE